MGGASRRAARPRARVAAWAAPPPIHPRASSSATSGESLSSGRRDRRDRERVVPSDRRQPFVRARLLHVRPVAGPSVQTRSRTQPEGRLGGLSGAPRDGILVELGREGYRAFAAIWEDAHAAPCREQPDTSCADELQVIEDIRPRRRGAWSEAGDCRPGSALQMPGCRRCKRCCARRRPRRVEG